MKKIFLILVMLFAFGMNANAQDVASSENNFVLIDNSTNYTKDTEDSKIMKLKAHLLEKTKIGFSKMKVPSDLEVILITDSSMITTWYASYFKDGEKKLILGILHGKKLTTLKYVDYIENQYKNSEFLVYVKR